MDASALASVLYFFVPAYLANVAPIVARGHVEWLAGPMDGSLEWRGWRLLGDNKAWGRLAAGIIVGSSAFAVQWWLWQRGVGMAGAYACVSIVFVPQLLETISILPTVFAGDIATTRIGHWLGIKEVGI